VSSPYHGKHESHQEVDELLDKLVDLDKVLADLRREMLAWEQADPNSDAEGRAAGSFTASFALLDYEAKHGNLPAEWRVPLPAEGPRWTPYQFDLVHLFGTCASCGGPRNVRNKTDGMDHWKQVSYCTICGETSQ
jgi:hypothetical protein